MSVPSPKVTPVLNAGGSNQGEYRGAVGVSGEAQTLNVSLLMFPLSLRQSAYFQQNLKVEFKSLAEGLSQVGPDELSAGQFGANNEYVILQVSSDSVDNACKICIENRHSPTR